MEKSETNPFANAPALSKASQQTANAVANTDQQRAIAEVQAAMMIARMNPRNPVAAMDRILNACARPTLAESAVYTYAKGGSDVSGPSIRLAETMAQAWGNIQFGIRELDQRMGESTVQAFAWDVETNTRREVTFQVPHIRHTRKGVTKLTDPRDVYELVANQGSRRLRACILAIIPGDVTETAVNQCEVTMKTTADTSPEAMQKMVTAFDSFGVTKEQIEKRIQRRLESIQPAQVASLKKIYASLRDGMSAANDWFDADAQTAEPPEFYPENMFAKELPSWKKIIEFGKKTAADVVTMIESKHPLTPEQKAIVLAIPVKPVMDYAYVAHQLNTATSETALNEAKALIENVRETHHRDELHAIHTDLLSKLDSATS